MPRLDLEALRSELLAAGVAPAYVKRTIEELREHREDAEADALAAGYSSAAAASEADARIGSASSIKAAVVARPELQSWAYRWPRTAHCLESAAFVAVLPAVPFVYCACRKRWFVRWSLSASLAFLLTAALLFSLQSLISWALASSGLPG